jgi:hypothetical protein
LAYEGYSRGTPYDENTEKVRRYLAEKEHYGFKNNNTIQSKTNQNKKNLTQHEL